MPLFLGVDHMIGGGPHFVILTRHLMGDTTLVALVIVPLPLGKRATQGTWITCNWHGMYHNLNDIVN